jgi:hypothetical protein
MNCEVETVILNKTSVATEVGATLFEVNWIFINSAHFHSLNPLKHEIERIKKGKGWRKSRITSEKLLEFERKILKKIYGPIKEIDNTGGPEETMNYITLLVIEILVMLSDRKD